MLRMKITELGKLNFLDDGGLVCSVTLLQSPSLEPSVRAASLYMAPPAPTDLGELTIGDLVAHSDHGIARYRGRKIMGIGAQKCAYLVLEFAGADQLFVPVHRSGLVRKLRGAPIKLSTLDAEGAQVAQSYCVEALSNAYEWPGIGTFPKLPQESTPEAMAEWRRACTTYQNALHANTSYRQAAQEYFERQSREPQPLLDGWVYRAMVLRLEPIETANVRNRDEHFLLIKQYVLRRERKVEKIRREVETLENCGSLQDAAREPIPENVRLFVWQRDKGQCVRCGSRERLEFDHIIPVVAGGSNTERNIQLLCESRNRSKSSTV